MNSCTGERISFCTEKFTQISSCIEEVCSVEQHIVSKCMNTQMNSCAEEFEKHIFSATHCNSFVWMCVLEWNKTYPQNMRACTNELMHRWVWKAYLNTCVAVYCRENRRTQKNSCTEEFEKHIFSVTHCNTLCSANSNTHCNTQCSTDILITVRHTLLSLQDTHSKQNWHGRNVFLCNTVTHCYTLQHTLQSTLQHTLPQAVKQTVRHKLTWTQRVANSVCSVYPWGAPPPVLYIYTSILHIYTFNTHAHAVRSVCLPMGSSTTCFINIHINITYIYNEYIYTRRAEFVAIGGSTIYCK